MNKSVIKAGIIGSGFAARFHFDALKRVFSTKVEVVGAYARNGDKVQQFTVERNIQAFRHLDDLIDACDVLHICTPPVTHESLLLSVLQKNKHAIVEKPFTGYFGDGSPEFHGDTFPRQKGLDHTLASLKRMLEAEKIVQGGSCMQKIGFMHRLSKKKEKSLKNLAGKSSGCLVNNPILARTRLPTANGAFRVAGR